MARKDSEESKKENEKRTEVGRPLADALFFDLGDEVGWFHGKNSAKVTVIFRRGPLIVGSREKHHSIRGSSLILEEPDIPDIFVLSE
jgi:hypothetical protein